MDAIYEPAGPIGSKHPASGMPLLLSQALLPAGRGSMQPGQLRDPAPPRTAATRGLTAPRGRPCFVATQNRGQECPRLVPPAARRRGRRASGGGGQRHEFVADGLQGFGVDLGPTAGVANQQGKIAESIDLTGQS